jgi:hypothetical protein
MGRLERAPGEAHVQRHVDVTQEVRLTRLSYSPVRRQHAKTYNELERHGLLVAALTAEPMPRSQVERPACVQAGTHRCV